MLLTRRALLLAEVVLLLGLCAAGAGCQSGLVGHSCLPGSAETAFLPGGTPVASTTWPVSGGSRKPVFTVARQSFVREPAGLAGPCGDRCCSAATMLPPVPVPGTTSPQPLTEAPTLRRVSGEVPIVSSEAGVSRLVTMERPQPVAFVPAMRPEGELPPPTPGGIDPAAAPPARINAQPGEKGVLPPPRIVPRTPAKNRSKPALEGFPDLPPPTITHPPAAPREYAKRALSTYIIEPPDVLQIDLSPAVGDKNFPIRGVHLVRPDGTVGLGPVGHVFVAGLTLDQAKFKIAQRLTLAYAREVSEEKREQKLRDILEGLKVDVAAYNSKFYYVITDGAGFGEQVYRVLCTGNETVLDAISQIAGLPAVASKSQIWVARATPTEVHTPNILPVDWRDITMNGRATTNYQIYPGDRIYVNSDKLIRADSFLAKVFSPIERILGITLLGSTTVNSIKGNAAGR